LSRLPNPCGGIGRRKEHRLGKFSQTLDHLGERPGFKAVFTQEGFPLHDLRGVTPCAASQLAGGSAF